MPKNKRTLLILLLFLCVVGTSAFIGTLAKYLTSSTVSDEAVVAKFGLNIPNTISLFSDSYDNVEADTPDKKIIAPGTSGQYNFVVTGTSEVDYKVSATVEVNYSEEWDGYHPLEFSLNGTTWMGLADFKADLATALESNVLKANVEYTNGQTIYWRWPFYVSEENDIKDTQMGVAAATETAPGVTININAIAAQITE